ncbi:hypothetical protein M9435_006539 [Picochlorum sp. BPE23]|nr:hypothetical protein M9435_006539 [Picochlorum sp. BPE23]
MIGKHASKSDSKKKGSSEDEEYKAYTAMVVECAEEFIDLFSDACNSSLKSEIATAIHHQRIHRDLQQVDMQSHLHMDSAHRIFKRCYGWRTWIHAPEEGVRGMIRELITLYYAPLKRVLDDVHGITCKAAELAMEECELLKAPSNEGLKQLMEEQAYESIDDWKDRTWDQLSRNLHAEVEFPDPQRFRNLREAIDDLLEEESRKQTERLINHYQNMIQISMKNLKLQHADIVAMKRDSLSSHAVNLEARSVAAEPLACAQFYMGWLEKKNRFGRWQRRWVVLSAEKKRLWYFAHPEEQPARGAASLVGCSVFPDVHEDGANELTFRVVFSGENSTRHTTNDNAFFHGGKTKSGMVSLTLRAPTMSSKSEWLDMIGKAIVGESIKGNSTTPSEGTAERKISTQIFEEDGTEEDSKEKKHEEENSQKKMKKPVRTKTLKSHGVTLEDEDDDDEQRLEAEKALFDEIAQQTEAAAPSDEEAIMLACVTTAVKKYMVDCQSSICEQASKIIADGMLPMLHRDELHTYLLNVLIPQEK